MIKEIFYDIHYFDFFYTHEIFFFFFFFEGCNTRCNECISSIDDCDLCAGNRVNAPSCDCPSGTLENNQANCPACTTYCMSCSGNVNNCV